MPQRFNLKPTCSTTRPRIETYMTQSTATLRIGTRGSPLALVQARTVRSRLAAASGVAEETIELVTIRTTGDAIQDRPLAEAGGKGLFTKEIEEALLDGRIDLAVHSAKDVPTISQPGLMLAACLEREDPRDVFISRKASSFADLPQGATLGTTGQVILLPLSTPPSDMLPATSSNSSGIVATTAKSVIARVEP